MYQLSSCDWVIERSDFSNNQLVKLEPLFALSNGLFGVRGCLSEMPEGNMMGTYLGGVFDKNDSYTPDMVNLPCFLRLDIVFEHERFGVDDCDVLEHTRKLDMKKGLVFRRTRLKTPSGKILSWESYRIVSIVSKYICIERHILCPENFSGNISITHSLDADTETIDTWKDLYVNHYDVQKIDVNADNSLYTKCKLHDSRYPICVATSLDINPKPEIQRSDKDNSISATYTNEVRESQEFVFDRFSSAQSYFVSKDEDALSDIVLSYLKKYKAIGFEAIKDEHEKAMVEYWNNSDIVIEGDRELQHNIRFNIYELIAAGPRHDERTSIGARGLTGEQYRGHVFWDTDLFMLPFYVYQDPDSARNMLMYRYHTLDGARRFSAINYTKGARYSVQTADTGDDASPVYDVDSGLSPLRVGKQGDEFRGRLRVPWLTREEIHINGCIAYGVWSYYKATDDKDFILNYGLEILVEIARYWCSRIEWVKKNKRYELLNTVGGDEWHFHAKNNAYTNYLAWFSVDWAIKLYRNFSETDSVMIKKLQKKIAITDGEILEFEDKMKSFYLPECNEKGIIEQQDGWFELKPFRKVIKESDINMSVMRKTGTLPNGYGGEVNFKGIFAANDWQAVKQCDLIILFWLFPDLLERQELISNYNYYEERTVHMSSLSPNTSSIVASRLGIKADAYNNLLTSSAVDLCDYQFNAEWGLHYAAMGGTWNAMVFGFGGLYITKDFELELRPVLHGQWRSITYKFFWKQSQIRVSYDGRKINLTLLKGLPVDLKIDSREFLLKTSLSVEYQKGD
ncbi:MAG: glycoside hydrolase family 65 protein [Sedimentisphaeraceae bacterium JB056]